MVSKKDYLTFEKQLSIMVIHYAQEIFTEIMLLSEDLNIELTKGEVHRYFKNFTESLDYIADLTMTGGHIPPVDRGGISGPGFGSIISKKYLEFSKIDKDDVNCNSKQNQARSKDKSLQSADKRKIKRIDDEW